MYCRRSLLRLFSIHNNHPTHSKKNQKKGFLHVSENRVTVQFKFHQYQSTHTSQTRLCCNEDTTRATKKTRSRRRSCKCAMELQLQFTYKCLLCDDSEMTHRDVVSNYYNHLCSVAHFMLDSCQDGKQLSNDYIFCCNCQKVDNVD